MYKRQVLGGVGYFYREQTGLKDGMETLLAKVRDLVPDKNSGKESKAAEELAKADQSTESIENPDINTEEAADSSDSTVIQPESGEGTADDSDETTGNTGDNSEDTAQDESGNMSDEEKTEDNSSDSANQPEQDAAQAAAIDLNGVMPQACLLYTSRCVYETGGMANCPSTWKEKSRCYRTLFLRCRRPCLFPECTQLRNGCCKYGIERNRKYSGNVCDDGASF